MHDTTLLFASFTELKTERLRLRRVVPADAERTFAILSDPEVALYYGMGPLKEFSEAEERCRNLVERFESGEGFRLAIEYQATGEFIGTAGFWRFVRPHFRAEMGYELDRAHWGKGLITEALRALLAHGFQHGLHSVEANIHPDNGASRRVLEKLGFREEAHQREMFYEPHLGVFTDNIGFGLLKKEFFDGPLMPEPSGTANSA